MKIQPSIFNRKSGGISSISGVSTIVMCIALMGSTFAHAQYAQPDAKSKVDANAYIPKEIIKSVDARGRVSYSDRQILGNRQLQVMRSSSFQPVAVVATNSVKAPDPGATGALSAKPLSGTDPVGLANKAIADANVQIAKSNCQNAKMSLASLASGPRLVRMTPDGQRVDMTAEQIESDRAKATDAIAKNCG